MSFRLLKEEDCPANVFGNWQELLREFQKVDDDDINTEAGWESFTDYVIENFECGATLRIESYDKPFEYELNKDKVFELMEATEEEICENYSDYDDEEDEERDSMLEFGYEYFYWENRYILVSGTPA